MEDDLNKRSPDEGLFAAVSFLAKSGLSFVPGGAIAAELLTLVIADPAAKRRDKFLMDIAARLEALEAGQKIDRAELAGDERVGAILLQSTQVAQRSVGDDKREALRNATLRGVCDPDLRSLTPVVIGVIDRLTDNHLYILKGLAKVTRPIDPSFAKQAFQ